MRVGGGPRRGVDAAHRLAQLGGAQDRVHDVVAVGLGQEVVDQPVAEMLAVGAVIGRHIGALRWRIAQASGNHYFADIINHLGTSIIPRTRLNSARLAHDDQAHYMSRLMHEHEAIYEAIARRDSEGAKMAMRMHLSNSRERLRQAHEEAQAQRG